MGVSIGLEKQELIDIGNGLKNHMSHIPNRIIETNKQSKNNESIIYSKWIQEPLGFQSINKWIIFFNFFPIFTCTFPLGSQSKFWYECLTLNSS